jgi:hypothetical protein
MLDLGRRKFARLQFATAQGQPAEKADKRVGKDLETEEDAMNGIILVAPAVAALGALILLGLFAQARGAAKTNPVRASVAVRRACRP